MEQNTNKPFEAAVTGYGYADLGGPMAKYVQREVARMAEWRVATAQALKLDADDLERLKREQAQRKRQLERGEVEGPPNPCRAHLVR